MVPQAPSDALLNEAWLRATPRRIHFPELSRPSQTIGNFGTSSLNLLSTPSESLQVFAVTWNRLVSIMEVPTATSLSDIYPEDALPVETKRWESLLAKFKDLYGKQADFVARSPGRVNIIGEVSNSMRQANIQLTIHSTSTTPCTKYYLWLLPQTSSWQWLYGHPTRSRAYG